MPTSVAQSHKGAKCWMSANMMAAPIVERPVTMMVWMLNIVVSLSKFLKNLHILSVQLQLAGVDYFLAVDDGGEIFQEASV